MSQINHSSRSYLAKSSDFKSFKSEKKKNSLKARHNCRKKSEKCNKRKKMDDVPDVAKRTGCPATLLFQSKRLLDI